MGLSEADTRAKSIDPGLHARWLTKDLILLRETVGAIEVEFHIRETESILGSEICSAAS
jgi:hypothetical protein